MPNFKVKIDGSDPMMIKAKSRAAARDYALKDRIAIEPLSVEEAVELAGKGVSLIDVDAESAPPSTSKPAAKAEAKHPEPADA